LARTLLAIDGIAIEREEIPESADELAATVRRAFECSTPMVPVGGESKLHLGNPPLSPGLAVRTCKLRGVVEYEPDNMTVSVLAGTTLKELQDTLSANRQFLPLDPPHPERATAGGLVSCNTSGPIRFRYGTVRDFLLGAKIVHADGTATKAGGKLVKNVTGYDMCKLYTGALGTLGILTELTFKVQPQPEAVATAFIAYPSMVAALEATQVFLKSDLLPDAMEIWSAAAAASVVPDGAPAWTMMLRFGEVAPAVDWQVHRVRELAPARGGEVFRVIETAESEEFWHAAASQRGVEEGEDALVKCSVLYQSTAATASVMEQMAEKLGAQVRIYCHGGNYVLYGRYSWSGNAPPGAEDLRQALRELRRHCTACNGHMVVEKVRHSVKEGFDVWGYEAPALEIMRRIKREFDPMRLLNPGRFVGGI
jgi:glycolate oxidase FAD binding subunit